jgi:Zn-finger nucleic acid-binding protein
MICPKCNTNLVMSDNQGVEIDYCPNCRGVWLDRGELEKIIERSHSYDKRYSNDNEHYGHKDHHNHDDEHYGSSSDYRNHNSQKRGFLSNLFDF